MKKFLCKTFLALSVTAMLGMLSSCGGGRKYLVIPHSVSTASAVQVSDLNLAKGDYEVLNSVNESATVICEYKGTEIRIVSGNGDFEYRFELQNNGWVLKNFSGAAELGYFATEYQASNTEVPNAEEFARRVAMAKVIRIAKDYRADGVIEPITVSNVSNLGKNKIEITSVVTAKLISIKTTK